ncbi:MAG: 3-oxoacyl-ACP reductase FabG [Ectothiorhodospiraceae bacterium]|nr:3-oxoacyl-ACP reductase FabG [Ectothiorhodospiraceae bacterium]
MGRLRDKVALVTGGNTGIGRAVCLAFAREGADVAVGYLDDESATASVVASIEALGRRATGVQVDVTDEQSVQAMVESATGALGRIDVLVNNAGIQKAQPIEECSVDDFDRMLAVHLRGAFLCSRAVVAQMARRGGGRIINVCSQLGYIGRGNYTAYSAAKGGLIAFTRALARELAPRGILVNGVSPGLVDTGFDPLSDEVKRAHAASLPLGRLGTPDDMVSAFVFLASDEAAYYCGQLLHPNGGEIMP